MQKKLMCKLKKTVLLIAVFAVSLSVPITSEEMNAWVDSLETEVVGPVRVPWGIWGVRMSYRRLLNDRLTLDLVARIYPVLSRNVEPSCSGFVGAGYHFKGAMASGWFTRFLCGAGYAPGGSDFFITCENSIGYREVHDRVSIGFGMGPHLEIYHYPGRGYEEWIPDWSFMYSFSLNFLF